MAQITINDLTDIISISVAGRNVPPGSLFLDYFANEMINGKTIVDIADELAGTAGFLDTYPAEDSNKVFATKFISNNMEGGTHNLSPKDSKVWAINWLTDLLDGGASRGEAMVAFVDAVSAATSSDPHWGDVADLFHNKVILASYYSDNPAHATDIDGMIKAMALITPDYASVALAKASVDTVTTTVELAGSPIVTEGGNAIYTLSRVGDLSGVTTVDFTLTGGNGDAASADYGIPSDAIGGITLAADSSGGTISFPAFSGVASFVVPIVADEVKEAGEALTVTLTSNPTDKTSLISPTKYSVTTDIQDIENNKIIVGNDGNGLLKGNSGNNVIYGNGGNDTLIGGAGKDELTGGAGKDVFRYIKPTDGGDTITDFGAKDTLQFSKAGFGGHAGVLPQNGLLVDDHAVSAQTAAQHFIYDTSSHNLYYDADANSGVIKAILIGTFANGVELQANDIVIGG